MFVSHSEPAGSVGEIQRLEGFRDGVDGVGFSADGQTAVSVDNGRVRLWHTDTGRELLSFYDPTAGRATCVALSPDGKRVLCGNASLQLWHAATGKVLVRFSGHTDLISSVVFSADGRRGALWQLGSHNALWDTITGKELKRFEGNSSVVFAWRLRQTAAAHSPQAVTAPCGSGTPKPGKN